MLNSSIEVVHCSPNYRDQKLLSEMYKDRAYQFKVRRKWNVSVDENGEEIDQYDLPYTNYLIVRDRSGRHAGSLRLLPLSKPTMLFDHFYDLLQGIELNASNTWECTRFCLARNLSRTDAREVCTQLFRSLEVFAAKHEVERIVAIFEREMLRVYQALGVPPKVLSKAKFGNEEIQLGCWESRSTLST